ncbi:DUF4153 domain-containing protein [Eisenibacter elegans]|uniref:DUF4153 domain-containing protein n=1 Tax=Eisenibacter elegans TaxID=997 RepID=UPI00041AAB85|nr:DUF4153 domain-containing protein [Eisenibacter elegans]
MRFTFSVQELAIAATRTLLRFPGVLLMAFVMVFTTIIQIELEYNSEHNVMLTNLTLCAALGLPISFALRLFGERLRWSELIQQLAVLGLIGLLGLYYWSLPTEAFRDTTMLRFVLWNIAAHLLVAFAPYIRHGHEANGFWQFNQYLFIRLLTAGVYSFLLYFGLSVALLSIDQLFNVNIPSKLYLHLFTAITGIFNTWFFLAGVPQDWEELQADANYPVGLKILTQYVLLPLVVIYLVILYVYMGKIILTWSLPKGWVSYLILAFSTAGIFALLLIHPIREKLEARWIQTFSRVFYIALLPLIVLLFVAIGRRVLDYGVTEQRYFGIVLGVWLLGISLYFLLSPVKRIRYIPISLCLISFLAAFGPWGAASVSIQHQTAILAKELQEVGYLDASRKVLKGSLADDSLSAKRLERIENIIAFLSQRDAESRVAKLIGLAPDSLKGINTNYQKTKYLMSHIQQRSPEKIIRNHWTLTSQNSIYDLPFDLRGFDYLIPVDFYKNNNDSVSGFNKEVVAGDHTYLLTLNHEKNSVDISEGSRFLIQIPLQELITRYQQKVSQSKAGDNYFSEPVVKLTLLTQNQLCSTKLIINTMDIAETQKSRRVETLRAILFIRSQN